MTIKKKDGRGRPKGRRDLRRDLYARGERLAQRSRVERGPRRGAWGACMGEGGDPDDMDSLIHAMEKWEWYSAAEIAKKIAPRFGTTAPHVKTLDDMSADEIQSIEKRYGPVKRK